MFTIGEFSKICQVSVKTLHHYDRIGLLKPEKVDTYTGYRYYSQNQMDTMLLIQRLKRYGFSLEEARGFLDCTDKRALFFPKEKVTPNGVTGAVYYDKEFNQECSDIELIVGIREKEKADKVMESALCAVAVHKGGYSTLSDAYAALVSWIQENNYECNGAPYDIYVKTGFDGLPAEEWETEVYFPVKRK
ncbi:MAG: MerR family transcriptional regulator [Coprococcus sp.]|nr:MerR family transcriptional regulator [Coprococcus sp.]